MISILLRKLSNFQDEPTQENKLKILYFLLDELDADVYVLEIVNYHLDENHIEKLITFIINYDDGVTFSDEWDGSDIL